MTYKFIIKGGVSLKSIYLQVIINRNPRYYPIGYRIKPEYWDYKKEAPNKKCPDYIEITSRIEDFKQRAARAKFQLLSEGRYPTHDLFFSYLNIMPYKRDVTYVDFVKGQLEEMKLTMSINTINAHKSDMNKFNRYFPKILMIQIDRLTVLKFIERMRKDGNNDNTVAKSLKNLKAMINRYMEIHKNAIEYPFKGIPVKFENGKREYLEPEELKQLLNLYHFGSLPHSYKNVLSYFLFSCFIGLRFSDISQLKFENIKTDHIYFRMQKTEKMISIPLSENAKQLLPPRGLSNTLVFKVYTNQVTNRILKNISEKAGIQKKLTYHCARHTFGTIAVDAGIDLAIIQDLMGHSKISTTRIYSRIREHVKTKSIQKIDALLNEQWDERKFPFAR